ncbi:hybrid sensor histidine kinase/response regulator [Niastella yeongjuensis]|uniref:histidine kinase n=1 Tax=Niastella yeongjuensis TaxID=354355 RepID=A0A1V9EF03_9BACT|nr:two-component regulator propeller domain-containing protein [Niastella yeongjuensis]OQP44534.1 hybrid sensor histidine kinase/response regulator [Niastella yeongjuensis]SEO84390.1 Signal transduction histidine kinase [Niastella yeongjuensis]
MSYKAISAVSLLLTLAIRLHADNYPVRYLGIDQGLSNNAVTTIYQDYKGFMWFGTYDGLNRYDGYGFRIFRNVIGDSTSLNNNTIYTIEGDAANNIWVGGPKGACVFDPVRSTFSRLQYQSWQNATLHYVQDNVHTIQAAAGYMFIGSQQGLLVFENKSKPGVQIPLQHNTNYDVTAIEPDNARHTVWLFIQQVGLCQYDLFKKQLQIISTSIKQGSCLQLDKQGNVWLGNENGLYQFNTATHQYSQSYLPYRSKIVNLYFDKQHTAWIGSDGNGLLVLPPGAAQAMPYWSSTGKSVVNSNAVYAVYEDTDGRKWIGTLRGGINVVESRTCSFAHITYHPPGNDNLVNNFIMSFCEDEKHNVWIGTDGAGLRYWDRQQNGFTQYMSNNGKSAISSNFITSIVRDYNNEIWVSTWLGAINRFNRKTGAFTRYDCYNPITHEKENNVWLLYQDAQNRLWASATNEGSLYVLNRPNDRFELFDNTINNLQCLCEDRQGVLWGGNYSTLLRIDRDRKQHIRYNIGHTLRCIHEDRTHNFWIGTQDGGLLLFDRKTGNYKRFTTADGLPGNTILRLLEDEAGNLWLSTYNGLCRFNPQTKAVRNFSQSDGLQSNQFSFNAGVALSSGEFLFGGIKGFNLFYPDSIKDVAEQPAIYLTGLKINNTIAEGSDPYVTARTFDRIDEITIPFERAVLSLDFLALEYAGADKINYAYFLQGWDKDWNYVNHIRTANYSRLQEGTYFFKVKIMDPDGTWGHETKLLQIIVLPPWYRTWWAYSLYGLCFAGAICLYIRYTRSQERLRFEIRLAHVENEKEKELMEKKLTFFTNISHEFRTPLSLIINPVKEALNNEPRNDLKIAYRNARRLLSLVDQLLLFRKADNGSDTCKIAALDIIQLCDEVYQCFVHQARTKNITYQFVPAIPALTLYADYEKVEIALFNLLSNAFKFTPENGTILFKVTETTNSVELSIRDTGCGIDATDRERIFEKFQQAHPGSRQSGFGIGLFLVKQFIESHQGTVTCNSVLGHGTTFTIILLKGTAHLSAGCEFIATVPVDKNNLLQELAAGVVQQPEEESIVKPVQQQGKLAEEVITNKRSILLIDDNPEITQYLQQIFETNYLVFATNNGDDGYELALQQVPDLIISDIHMQGMDGIELCSKLKKSELLGHIPVILLTASTTNEIKLKGIEGGADDYITKPFDKTLLQAKVETILRNRNLLQRFFFDSITLKETNTKVPAEYQEFLRKCIAVIEQNIDTEDFTIKKFSKAMGMSHPALYNKVKSISGQSLNAFIRSIRLRRAAVLMLTENMNIRQAAFQVGINDVRYFREQFVKVFHMMPSEYIKKYRHSFNREYNVIKSSFL